MVINVENALVKEHLLMQTKHRNMDIKQFAIASTTVFSISLLVTLVVNFLWSLVFHGIATIDWETAFRFAILFGIIIPILHSRTRK
jgi:hypothetical protein